jgi:hypothetical protein
MMERRCEGESSMTGRRGEQAEYNRLLDTFGSSGKTYQECVEYLISLGFTDNQAKNAVHLYRRGDATHATFRLSGDRRDRLLDDFGAGRKAPRECADYLMKQGCTYRQATSAVCQFRKEKGLIP